MIEVTCEVMDYSEPAKPRILVHSHFGDNSKVEIVVNGTRQTVVGNDLITAINNCMHTNSRY